MRPEGGRIGGVVKLRLLFEGDAKSCVRASDADGQEPRPCLGSYLLPYQLYSTVVSSSDSAYSLELSYSLTVLVACSLTGLLSSSKFGQRPRAVDKAVRFHPISILAGR